MKRCLLALCLLGLLTTCQQPETEVPALPPTLLLADAYSVSNTEAEGSLMLSGSDPQVSEVGVVWADKPGPTTSNTRQSITGVGSQTSFFLKMPGIGRGQTVYVRGYYIRDGATTYSPNELTFSQNFSGTWQRLAAPKLDPEQYVTPDQVLFSGSFNGLTFYAVNRTTSVAKTTVYYPTLDQWDADFFRDRPTADAQMRFGMFRASFTTPGGTRGILVGGGYYKQPTGERFYLKDYKLEGFDGYKWDPPHPGADVPTSSFGLGTYGYVLENRAEGKLWRFDPLTLRWEAVSNVPVRKEGRFLSFALPTRAFVLAEPASRTDAAGGLYEFIPARNEWQLRNPFPGENRRWGVAFVFGNKLYYGAGQSAGTLRPLRDLWAYDPATDTWGKVATYPGYGTVNLAVFATTQAVYLGFGQQVVAGPAQGEAFTDVNDLWQFRP
jgi:hypothetical protein